jgi:hypothetical protein
VLLVAALAGAINPATRPAEASAARATRIVRFVFIYSPSSFVLRREQVKGRPLHWLPVFERTSLPKSDELRNAEVAKIDNKFVAKFSGMTLGRAYPWREIP